jgi:hypothetical protein
MFKEIRYAMPEQPVTQVEIDEMLASRCIPK